MVRLLLYVLDVVLTVLLWKVLGRALRGLLGTSGNFFSSGPQSTPRHSPPEAPGGKMARDPVCGMFVSTELSHRLVQGSETLHFCSSECLERYTKDGASAAV
jgi:YHS domain-containing protein